MSNVRPEVIPQQTGSWFNPWKGSGAPSSTIGGVGDTYVDTTNNQYYFKGDDGWHTVSGSTQSIPAASTANTGSTLWSNGSSWTTTSASCYKRCQLSWNGSAVCLFRRKNTASNYPYFAIVKGFAGAHNTTNGFYSIAVHGQGASFLSGNVTIDISLEKAHGQTSSTAFKATDFKFYTSSDGSKLYVQYAGSTSDGGITAVIYSAHGGFFYSLDNSEVFASTSASGLTEITTGITYNTSVPCSTAANQMLVSDGNGGWNVRNAIPCPTCTTTDNGKVLKVVDGVPTWSST